VGSINNPALAGTGVNNIEAEFHLKEENEHFPLVYSKKRLPKTRKEMLCIPWILVPNNV
jgi:hypothetical protein